MIDTEYPKIETAFNRGPDFKVIPSQLRNPSFGLIKEWIWTEKIDGTNIRLIWDNNAKTISIRGRTDNAQLPGGFLEAVKPTLPDIRLLSDVFKGSDAVIYGEGYGAGIQKAGHLYSANKKFIAFDVFIVDNENKFGGWWLNHEAVRDVCRNLHLEMVPVRREGSIGFATEQVQNGLTSLLYDGAAEGLVGRTIEPLFDKRGNRLIVKLKTKDF